VGVVVTAASGYDLGYVWRGQQQADSAAERAASGGYYLDAARAGEAPGRWSGRGAEALGFGPGQVVERTSYEAVYRQTHPQTGERLGRAPGGYTKYAQHLDELLAAEPYATSERVAELERQAAAATRKSPSYTDVTVSYSKSISILHASIRANEQQARAAGDEAAAGYWATRAAELAEVLQAANRAGLEHLEQWAVTRTGYHGARVDGQEPGRYEAADLVVTSWLQGTSRDGDPQDHIHNQIARVVRTRADGKWRALDTMSVRAQLPAVQAIVTAHVEAALTRRFGVQWVSRVVGAGREVHEIRGITQAQIDAYSTRAQTIADKTPAAVAAWTAKHGRAPNRRELLHIQQEVTMATRQGKEPDVIDWGEKAEEWDAQLGGELAPIAPAVSNLGGGGGAEPEPGGPAPDAQARAIQTALARVQEAHSTWTRADLLRELASSLPAGAHALPPDEAVALLHQLADRAVAGETERVVCLEAPEWPPLPGQLRRDLDGRSVYTRPGTARYATHLQLSREEQLLADAQRQGAPALAPEWSAALLGASTADLGAAARTRAQEASAQLPGGLRLDQAAALQHAITSPRVVSLIVGPAGSGKTRVLAEAARIWPGEVIGIAPSQAAARVLAAAAGVTTYNTAQFLGHTREERGALGPVELRPGTLILLDEGSMTGLEDMAAIIGLAAAGQGKVIIAGDHGQLTAVEGGGGMALLARELEHTQLAEPVRFAAAWEREASLRLRAGDAAVLTQYDQHGRIHGGGEDYVMDEVRKAYVAGYLTGRDVLAMAADLAHCRELSQRIREDLQHLGRVDTGAEVSLRDGGRASIGDLIITRENDHRLGVANGDTWRVEEIRPGGQVVMRKAVDADPATGERRYADHTVTYDDCQQSADLGYVVTGHSAQGRTVAWALALITGSETREWVYVALSRGAERNDAYVRTETAAADPRPGTRAAPELARHERVQAERDGQAGPAAAAAAEREPIAVLSDVLERTGAERSALEEQRRNLAQADHLGRLHPIWQAETKDAVQDRYERSLRDQLPEAWRDVPLSARSTWLWRSLRGAEAAGLNADEVLARAITTRSLDGTRDLAAVLDNRIREQTGALLPLPARPWSEQVPDIADPARRGYVAALAEAMDDRRARLGEHTAETCPPWAVHALGPVPADPVDRLEWEQRAGWIAAYREAFGYADPAEPIGPEPTADAPEKRGAWHAAFAALGPVDGVDVRQEPDGRLLHMRAMYEAETAWAPQWVGDELRQVRRGAHDAALAAARADAEADAARGRGDQAAASRHAWLAASSRAMAAVYLGHETTFAETMAAREEWERSTRWPRHLAVAADSEYRRRHPEVQLSPLRSAEPARATDEQRQALDDPEQAPAWVTQLAERCQATRDKLAELAAERIPAEDHEWQDEGLAWPDPGRADRDAVLQPPRPEIRAAAELAELVRHRELEYEPEPEAEAGG
jgi:conjugative relaxase-like TrwC/TraI family protein